jgi:hypothetical protein
MDDAARFVRLEAVVKISTTISYARSIVGDLKILQNRESFTMTQE